MTLQQLLCNTLLDGHVFHLPLLPPPPLPLLLQHQVAYKECGYREGYAPIVTIPTLHEVHYLLFFVAIVHIFTGAVVMLLSTIKLK